MSEPCRCHECVVAGCTRPPVTLPATSRLPAVTLHGRRLQQHYAAQDRLRETIARLRSDSRTEDPGKEGRWPGRD